MFIKSKITECLCEKPWSCFHITRQLQVPAFQWFVYIKTPYFYWWWRAVIFTHVSLIIYQWSWSQLSVSEAELYRRWRGETFPINPFSPLRRNGYWSSAVAVVTHHGQLGSEVRARTRYLSVFSVVYIKQSESAAACNCIKHCILKNKPGAVKQP